MMIIQHLWEFLIFVIVLAGPLPISIAVLQHRSQTYQNLSFSYALLFVLSIWSISQVSLGILLGSFSQLFWNPVIAVELLLFWAGLWLCKHYRLPPLQSFPKSLPPLGDVLRASECLLLASIGALSTILFVQIATQPITNYDSLWFHLPVVTRWYQTGRLTLLDPAGYWIFEHPSANQYPYNWHILSVFCLLPFKEDFLVTLPMLLAWAQILHQC